MSAPVRHTCPNIDKALKCIKQAWAEIKDAIDEKQTLNSIECELDMAADILEDLRNDNGSLRLWGHELEDEIKGLNDYVAELETRLEDAKQSTE